MKYTIVYTLEKNIHIEEYEDYRIYKQRLERIKNDVYASIIVIFQGYILN